MKENFKEIIDKVTEIFFNIVKKFDGISEEINKRTGMKINVGLIVVGGVLIIITLFFVKMILSFLWSLL